MSELVVGGVHPLGDMESEQSHYYHEHYEREEHVVADARVHIQSLLHYFKIIIILIILIITKIRIN